MKANKTELNNAIFEVITTKYKKDAKEAHALVSACGYEIIKYDGAYMVINESTHKRIRKWNGYRYIRFGNSSSIASFKCIEDGRKIDFVNYLNTRRPSRFDPLAESKFEKARRLINDQKREVRQYECMAEAYQNAIENAARELARAKSYQAEAVARLDALRKEYGLKGGN